MPNPTLPQRPSGVRTASLRAVLAASALAALAAGPGDRPSRRARPPGAAWDKATAGAFFADAFAELKGPRPDLAAALRPAAPGPTGSPAATGGQPDVEPTAAGFTWSALVSGDTLTDEILELKDLVGPTVASASAFKGGGFGEAQKSFSMLALAFGVIAAHDEDIRWKRDAATARDLFARVGFNCKVGTDQSFNEAKRRVEDLEAMIQGDPPRGVPDRDEDFRWSQVAGRPPLMKRLETAEKALAEALASPADFARAAPRAVHEAEIVAAIAEVVQQPDFEFHDDDSYRGHAAAMRDAAVKLRAAAQRKAHAPAAAAAAAISQSCNACHGDYR